MNETINNLINRKSCRSFKNMHVEQEKIDLIVKSGLNAPSGKNLQTPIFVVVQNEEIINKLSKLNASFLNAQTDPFYGARDLIIVLAKKVGLYQCDGALAMGNLLNAAYSLNVDSIWINRAKEVFETNEGLEIIKSLGIDFEVEGIAFCCLGYHKDEKPKTVINENRVYYIK